MSTEPEFCADAYKASNDQESMWLFADLYPDQVAHNLVVRISLRAESTEHAFDCHAFEQSLVSLFARHTALTSTFHRHGNTVQVTEHPERVPSVQWLDSDTGDIDAFTSRVASQPFALDRDLLVRVYGLHSGGEATVILVAHHMIVDGFSLRLMTREVGLEYSARVAGLPLPLFLTSAPFRDYAVYARQNSAHESILLRPVSNRFSLSGDRSTDNADRKAKRLEFRIDASSLAGLRSASEAEGLTPFAVLYTCFQILLRQYAQTADISIAVPIAGRLGKERRFRRTVGLLTSTVVLNTRVNDDSDFLELANDNARLLRELSGARHQHQQHESDILFSYHRGRHEVNDFEGFEATVEELCSGFSKSDLELSIIESAKTLVCFFEYRTAKFRSETIAQLVTRFRAILDRVLSTTASSITHLSSLSTEELRQTRQYWYGPDKPFLAEEPDSFKPLHELIKAQVRLTPDDIAVFDEDNRWTYTELDDRASAVAAGLQQCGVGKGGFVGIAMSRSLHRVPAMLGVLNAGAAYIPLDPDQPAARLQSMCNNAGLATVLVDEHVDKALFSNALVIGCQALYAHSAPYKTQSVVADDPIYAIYTSGSTGTPKAAVNSHAGVRNRILWMQNEYQFDSTDIVLQKTPFGFDVSGWEFFLPLVSGGTIAVAGPDVHKDPKRLIATIIDRSVTTIHFVPSMLEAFLNELQSGNEKLACLKRVFTSGEALSYDLMCRCCDLLPHVELHNLYGPTEAAIDVTYWQCQVNQDAIVPIGRPVANTSIYLLNDYHHPVPPGFTGELCIGGVQTGLGYLNAPELTASVFFDHPDFGRLYKTGDYARLLPNGNFEYLGRKDAQIKINGQRVELGEIESALRRQPPVREAAVLKIGNRLLATFIREDALLARDDEVKPEEILNKACALLPRHMRPNALYEISQLPISANGKLDRRALCQIIESRVVSKDEEIPLEHAPQGRMEHLLAGAFKRVLETDSVYRDDSFFALGGDSISILKLRATIEDQGYTAGLSDFLEHPTPRQLAKRLVPYRLGAADYQPFSALLPDTHRCREFVDAFPVSSMASAMLYQQRAGIHAVSVYQDVFSVRLHGALESKKIRSAFAALIRRHAVLRSCFRIVNGQLIQGVVAGLDDQCWYQFIDVDVNADIHIQELHKSASQRRFDTKEPPLLRLTLSRLSAQDHWITLSFHHAILDGLSVSYLFEEFFEELNRPGTTSESMSQRDCQALASVSMQEQQVISNQDSQQFWKEYFQSESEFEPCDLPAPYTTDNVSGQMYKQKGFVLSASSVHKLEEVSRVSEIPLKHWLLAIHHAVIRDHSGSPDVLTGVVTGIRTSGAERVPGLFINTLPYRSTLAEQTWAELAEYLWNQEKAYMAHRCMPLSEVIRLGAVKPFTTAFNFTRFRSYQTTRLGTLQLMDTRVTENTEFALLASFHCLDDTIRVTLDVDTRRIAQSTIEGLVSAYQSAVRAMLCDIHTQVIPRIEQPFSDTCQSESLRDVQSIDFLSLYDRMVELSPEEPALVFKEQVLSFSQLDCLANKVAIALQKQGVKAGDIVAVEMQVSVERLLAILAVLKLQAAYCPIDPELPHSRKQSMLSIAGPQRLLCDSCIQKRYPDLANLVCLDVRELLTRSGDTRQLKIEPESSPDQPAYVVFTSGSTGEPKGVIMPRRALSNLIGWQIQSSSAGHGDRTLQFSNYGFDVSFQEYFSTWCSGGTLVLMPDEVKKDIRLLPTYLNQQQIRRLFLPAVALKELAYWSGYQYNYPQYLKEVITAGDKLEITPALRTYLQHCPGIRCINQYGPTETHVVAAFELTPGFTEYTQGVPIGKALPNVRLAVCDRTGRPVPKGTVGELWVSGVCLATGYINRPELSQQRFGNLQAGAASRYYKTGDRVRELPTGDLEFIGRLDDQVKVRGFRVELSEVESVITAETDLSAVVKLHEQGENTVLVAFIARSATGLLDEMALRQRLSRVLPDYMIPSLWVAVDSFPKTSSGKLDRKSLCVPDSDGTPAITQPRNRTEEKVLVIFEEILGQRSIGTTRNFYDAGGNSLMALRLISQLEYEFAQPYPLARFIQAPSVRAVSDALTAKTVDMRTPLVCLKTHKEASDKERGQDKCPLVLFHPIGGNIACYRRLVDEMPSNRSIYAMESTHSTDRSVRQMAVRYADIIMDQVRDTAIHLGGWSFGGIVAVEVAHELTANDKEVISISLLDTVAPDFKVHKIDERSIVNWFAWELLGGDHGIDKELPQHFSIQNYADELQAYLQQPGMHSERITELFLQFKNNYQILMSHRPRAWSGDITLFRASEPLPTRLRAVHDLVESRYLDAYNGWRRFCSGDIKKLVVPGDHLSMVLDPNIQALAKKLASTLQLKDKKMEFG